MLGLKKLLVLATTLTSIVGSPVQGKRQASSSLDAWLTTESPRALQGVLDNIGVGGAEAVGAKAGIVIASPSRNDPPCWYLLHFTITSTHTL